MSSLTSQVLSSSFLLLLIRLFQRSLGLVSTLILARVLTPDDFGIVAIAMLVIHFCDTLSNAGSQQYIIQKDNLNDDDVNSSWTLDIILKGILWLLLLLAVPTITRFYDRPELENVLYASSCILIISALKSPGLILLRRDLNYKPIFKISIFQKLISFSIIMAIIYFHSSYWALIIGEVFSWITLTIGSYYIHPAKPRLNLSKIHEQWSFSQWVLLKGGVGFSRAESDTLLVSKYFSSEQLGGYHLSRYISIMPSTEIIAPAIEPLMASFARVKNDASQLAYQLSLSIFVVCILIIPISVFMFFFPEKIVDFLLGNQWAQTYTLLSALSIFLFTITISQVLSQCCIALGKVRSLFIYDVLSLIFIFTILLIFINNSLYDFALLRGILGLLASITLFIYISKISSISILYTLKLILPVFISALIATFVTQHMPFNGLNIPLMDLIFFLTIYGIIYIICIILFYITYYKNFREGQHLLKIIKNYIIRRNKIKTKTNDL